MFTQISAKKGMKQFGERAVVDMFKEYQQLNDGAMAGNTVFGTINNEVLSSEYRKKALEAENLIKEK